MKTADISAKLIGHYGDDLSVVNAARVSFEKESAHVVNQVFSGDVMLSEHFTLREEDIRLITYLAKHKHFSPFNHTFMSFRIKAPIFVARQLVKHKFMPWNEVSRRYVDSEPEFYIPEGFRAKAENVKQGSSEEFVDVGWWRTADNYYSVKERVEEYTAHALETYEDMLNAGVCPEMARMVLPANMMTEWIWSGTLGAFADMLKLRLDPHTQKESRDVATLIYEQAIDLFPNSLKALLENK